MADYKFYLKDKKSTKESQIRLHVHYNSKIAKVYIREKIHPENWSSNLQRAKQSKSFPEYPEFNQRLEDVVLAAKTALRNSQSENGGKYPDPKDLSKKIRIELGLDSSSSEVGLFEYFDKRIKEEEIRLRGEGSPPDRSSYPKSLKRTKDLLKEFQLYIGNEITYETITLGFYYDFLEYMQNEKGYMINTMGKYIKYVKSILKASYAEGLHNNRAFSHSKFKILTEEADTIYLDEDDLKLLETLDLKNYPGLDRARELFLVMSRTGVRFSDLKKISITNIQENNFVFRDQKERNEVVLPVFPIVRVILEKYGTSGLPIVTNQVFNRSLKKIGEKLEEASNLKGITAGTSKYRKITTHTARRSFATNLYHILPVNLIMSLTGHKTESEFFKYIRITPHENADRIRHLIPSLQSNKSNAN